MDWGCMSLDSRERRSAWRARICDRSWSAGSATYQLYHGITDTNLTLLPLPNEFFFGVFLKHRTTLSYRTLDPSAWQSPLRQTTVLSEGQKLTSLVGATWTIRDNGSYVLQSAM